MSRYIFIAPLKDESYIGNRKFNGQIPVGSIVEVEDSINNRYLRYAPLDLPITPQELKESFREIK